MIPPTYVRYIIGKLIEIERTEVTWGLEEMKVIVEMKSIADNIVFTRMV